MPTSRITLLLLWFTSKSVSKRHFKCSSILYPYLNVPLSYPCLLDASNKILERTVQNTQGDKNNMSFLQTAVFFGKLVIIMYLHNSISGVSQLVSSTVRTTSVQQTIKNPCANALDLWSTSSSSLLNLVSCLPELQGVNMKKDSRETCLPCSML